MGNETMRKEFEAHHRVPDEAFYKESVDAYKYEHHPNIDHPVNELWESFCDGWQAARAQDGEWKQAVDRELVTSLQCTADSYDSPRRALNELIQWNIDIATDPRVNGGYELRPAQSAEPATTQKGHVWNDVGERCLKCGDKDWFAPPECEADVTHPPAREQVKPQLDWIACSERLPTKADRDGCHKVWGFDKRRKAVDHIWWDLLSLEEYTHWKPTGLQRPEPPE